MMDVIRRSPTTELLLDVDGDMLKWATRVHVPDDLLDRLAEGRKANRRAPLGDKHGSWQKVAEIPLAHAFDKIPPDAWEDRRAWEKLLNSGELRAFRCDGDHRVF